MSAAPVRSTGAIWIYWDFRTDGYGHWGEAEGRFKTKEKTETASWWLRITGAKPMPSSKPLEADSCTPTPTRSEHQRLSVLYATPPHPQSLSHTTLSAGLQTGTTPDATQAIWISLYVLLFVHSSMRCHDVCRHDTCPQASITPAVICLPARPPC